MNAAAGRCVCCNHALLRRRHYQLLQPFLDNHPGTAEHIQGLLAPRQLLLNGEEYICRNCWLRVQYAINRDQGGNSHPQVGRPAQGNINVPEFSRAPNTANTCIFHECGNVERLRIPHAIKVELLVFMNFYIPSSARVCQEHLDQNNWNLLLDAPNTSHEFTSEQFVDMIQILQTAIRNNPNTMDFENLRMMDPQVLHYRVGLTRDEFERIIQETPSLAVEVNQPNTTLAIYLMKLRTGESNERLSVLFKTNRRDLERKMKIARECLMRDFVPRHLGFNHISRNEAAERNLTLPNSIYGNPEAPLEGRKVIIIIDGTYIYTQKSSNYLFQRESYSLHKYRNLLKPFLLVCCDGYIIDVTGPYAATTSDAVIMRSLINQNEDNDFHYYFEAGDVFICDRGFRDVMEEIEACGYEAHMPKSVQRGEEQLSTLDANKTRQVTLCRWVVEVVNGRFKRDFKLFRQTYFNRAMEHMMDDFKVAAALTNAFHVLIEDSQYVGEFVRIIRERTHVPNRLADYVTERNLNRQRVHFRNIEADIVRNDEFPILTEEELILFAVGTYQLKLARSYYSEHIRNGVYHIEAARDVALAGLAEYDINGNNAIMLRARIQSRHARARRYYSYVVTHNLNGRQTVTHYYCSCFSGRRTLGCCAHVMMVTWYFGWARYQPVINLPAANLDNIIDDINV